ncbi:hypothetical protein CPJCM30710_31470 [Clostridium polyendosporum]|uniref:DUF1648 domain-containing protein n=1 Tax=Clostridium polyendosporum TaxID=69208 RepID=A0A919VI80_9CLOT|nr:SdpI family protein [Clostridium polyendosporum]GIM30481.1 hypothetical protein CPJCM30710_31470 [Clostridium polyendosporum]
MKIKINKIIVLLLFMSLIGTLAIYNMLPDTVPTHWNYKGEVDKYSGKNSVFLTALLPVAMYSLFIFLPKIDPKAKNYSKHTKAYNITILMTILIIIGVHWASIFTVLVYPLKMDLIVKLLCGIMFIVIGNYMGQVKPNFFFGIRTPWTLANETVWIKTHRTGKYAFASIGVVFLISIFIKGLFGFGIVITSVIICLIYLYAYSYFEFKKISNNCNK